MLSESPFFMYMAGHFLFHFTILGLESQLSPLLCFGRCLLWCHVLVIIFFLY